MDLIPAAWAGEQLFAMGCHVVGGITINYCEEPETMMENLREISPTMVIMGPRQWESICSTIQIKMKDADWLKRGIFNLFLPIGLKMASCFFDKKPYPSGLKIMHTLGKWFVFRHLMDKVGFRNTRVFLTGSSLLSPDTFHFLYALGIKLRQGYAGSEFGFAIGHYGNDIRHDTIGVPAFNVEVKIQDSEIIVGGPTISPGYHKDPEKTREVFKDGWFYTGDAGYLARDGHIVYQDRVIDLATLANGTKYAPQFIEGRLRFSPYIRDAIAIGRENHPFISTIINIDFDMVGKWAEEKRIAYTTFADLSQKEEVANLVRKDIEKINKDVEDRQHIKKYTLLHKEFDADEGELTRTRKIRRGIMEERYHDLIDAIYNDSEKIVVEAHVKYRDGRTAVIKTDLKIWNA
ncbi:MAG: AMP-binding protein [Thermodesulfobacteriota bacterium]|nr:AMP-binding protein [Thermodesulfobacteriota bacterium]